jgi:hypothetical protein
MGKMPPSMFITQPAAPIAKRAAASHSARPIAKAGALATTASPRAETADEAVASPAPLPDSLQNLS